MLINYVHLENFGCVESFSKEFTKGVTVLSGQNGMGKSTVLKAILLAVFDDYQGTLQDYVRWDAGYFIVVVKFTHNGVDYETRVKYDGATDRTLLFQDKAFRGDEAKKKLRDIMDFELLKAGMLSLEQRVAIVETKPAERREYLKRIYDISFKKQLQELDEEAKNTQLSIVKESAVRNELEGRQYTLPDEPALPFSSEEYSTIKSDIELEKQRLSLMQEANRELQGLNSDITALKAQQTSLKSNILDIENRIADNKKKIDLLPSEKKLANEVSTKRIADYMERLASLDKDFNAKNDDFTEQLRSIVPLRLPTFDANEYNNTSQEIYSKKTKLTDLENAKDICPTCGQSISTPEHIAKRKIEIVQLKNEIAELSSVFATLSEKKRAREDAEFHNNENDKRYSELIHAKEMAQKQFELQKQQLLSTIEVQKQEATRIESEFEMKKKALEQLIDIDKSTAKTFEAQLQECESSLKEKEDKLIQLCYKPTDDVENKIQTLTGKVKLYDETAVRIAEVKKMIDAIEVQKAADQEQLKQARISVQKLSEQLGNLEMEQKVLKTDFPVYVIKKVVKDIENSMNEFLSLTYPKYKIEIQDKRNVLHIVYGPKKKDVSCASGFERQVFSLSFMIAISRAIGNKCLILDEADSAASDRNSQIFYKVLGNSIGHGIDQVILVSHKQATRDILQFDYNAQVVTFKDGVAA